MTLGSNNRSLARILGVLLQWRNVRTLLELVVRSPLALLSRLVPKRSIIVFGSRDGRAMDWNAKYLYLYMVTHTDRHPFMCYWVTRSKAIWQELTHAGHPALLLYRPRAVWTVMRARFAVVSASLTDIDVSLVKGAKIVQTFHGILFRRIGGSLMRTQMQSVTSWWGRALVKVSAAIWSRFNQSRFDYIVAPSEAVAPMWMEGFEITEDQIRVTGMPRDDMLYEEFKPAIRRAGERIVTYLPSHRDGMHSEAERLCDLLLKYGFDLDAAEEFLELHKLRFVMKGHHLHPDLDELDRLFAGRNRLQVYPLDDVMPLLRETDILLTDYSNIFHNFLHLDRPIIFTAFDLEAYLAACGFYVDYLSYTPGYKCRDWPETFEKIAESLETDAFREQRRALRDRTYKFQDGRNCRRICEWLVEWDRTLHK